MPPSNNNQEENKNNIITILDSDKTKNGISPIPQKLDTNTVIVENESKNLMKSQKNEKNINNPKKKNENSIEIKPETSNSIDKNPKIKEKTKKNENENNKIETTISNDSNQNDIVNYDYNSTLKKQKKTNNAKPHKQNALSSEDSSSMLEDPSSIFTINNNQDKRSKLSEITENPPVPIEEVDDSRSEIINESLVNLTKDKISYPHIYKYTVKNNKVLSHTMNLLKNLNSKVYKSLNTQEYVSLLEKNYKSFTAYQILCIYCMLENGKQFYKLKFAFNKWRNDLNIFKDKIKIKHNHKNYGHCLSCDCPKNSKKCPGCGCSDTISMCYNCSCKLSKIMLKKILYRQFYMKIINSKRYYLFLWFKKTFNKIRKINI